MNGPCAKSRVICLIFSASGSRVFTGENGCENPQPVCPREPGENYTKCKTICGQEGHAEEVALRRAGEHAKGGSAIVYGHSYACRNCQEALGRAGVIWLSVRKDLPTTP